MNKEKVDAPIIGANGNVFNLINICANSLKGVGFEDEAEEMKQRIYKSKSYDEALMIMQEYINPVEESLEADNGL